MICTVLEATKECHTGGSAAFLCQTQASFTPQIRPVVSQVSTLVFVMPPLWSHIMEKHLRALAEATVLFPAFPAILS
jgi:hypothetical protein